jgi:hypothetical protein
VQNLCLGLSSIPWNARKAGDTAGPVLFVIRAGDICKEVAGHAAELTFTPDLLRKAFPGYMRVAGPSEDSAVNPGRVILVTGIVVRFGDHLRALEGRSIWAGRILSYGHR